MNDIDTEYTIVNFLLAPHGVGNLFLRCSDVTSFELGKLLKE